MPRSLSLVVALSLLAAGSAFAQPVPTVVPRPGLVITRSVRVQPGSYRLRAPASPDSALIVVRGDDVTVDMRGVTLIPRHGTPVAVDRLATPHATAAPSQAPVASA